MAKSKFKIDHSNRFGLFINDFVTNTKSPDLQGRINVNGVEYRLAGWYRTSSKGLKYIGGTVEEIDNKRPSKHPADFFDEESDD